MRAFIIDQLLILFTGVAMAVGSAFAFKPIPATILILIIALVWGCWCRESLLLPLDVLLGAKSEELYFSCLYYADRCEFHRRKYYAVWQFYCGNHKIRRLTVPALKTEVMSGLPKADQKMLVKYYRLSKLVVTYEYL